MDRTVPRTGSEDIELYIRTYYSLLRASTDVRIRTLEEAHARMGSSLHPRARALEPDMSAFIYCSLRLPSCIAQVERVVLGQGAGQFRQHGVGEVESWTPVAAPARRRRSFFDGRSTLACYIGSGSDIDDVIPLLTAYQIEWNKLHLRMRGEQTRAFLREPVDNADGMATLAVGMGIAAPVFQPGVLVSLTVGFIFLIFAYLFLSIAYSFVFPEKRGEFDVPPLKRERRRKR